MLERMKKFHIVLIKPSKYDDDGYVIRFWKGVLPSNTLNVLHGLTEDVKTRRVFGNLPIEATTFVVTTEMVPLEKIIRSSHAPGTTHAPSNKHEPPHRTPLPVFGLTPRLYIPRLRLRLHLLHHQQGAGTKNARAHPREHRRHDAPELSRSRAVLLLFHRRQFRPQK